jgi:hypothetical protein
MKKPKIKYSPIYINLKNWLKINQHRFPVMPQITRLSRDGLCLVFHNVNNMIISFRTNGMVMVCVGNNQNFEIDISIEFDLS